MMKYLEILITVIARILSLTLLIAAGIQMARMLVSVYEFNVALAIQDGLFILILLELFFVVNAFIKYGAIDRALVISVGIVAVVKEVIFKLNEFDLQSAAALAIILTALSVCSWLEQRYASRWPMDFPGKHRSLKPRRPHTTIPRSRSAAGKSQKITPYPDGSRASAWEYR